MKELFYSPSDKKLFYIAGYTDNSYCVKTIIASLSSQTKYFLKFVGFPDNTIVRTDYITKSSRYKSMRYFWINDVDSEEIPEEAFVLNEDWDMYKWIEN